MLLMTYAGVPSDNKGGAIPSKPCIRWTTDGLAVIICDQNDLVNRLLPIFRVRVGFPALLASTNLEGPRKSGLTSRKRTLIFFHVHFQRDNKRLLSEMASITAEKAKKALSAIIRATSAASPRTLSPRFFKFDFSATADCSVS